MPLAAPFTEYPPATTDPPEVVGVYELGWPARTESGYRVVYVGMGSIATRLRAHARDEGKTWAVYRCLVTRDRRRAGQIERRELRKFAARHGRLPRFNEQIG